MAKIQLSGLPETAISANTDLFHISKSGVDYRITRENILLSLTETVAAVDGSTVALSWANTQVIGDTTVGDASITIPDGVYLNQELILSNQGTGFATYTHADFSYGIIVDTEHNPVIKWVSDGVGGFKWDVGSQVSAEYTDGTQTVVLKSDRGMINYHREALAFSSEGTHQESGTYKTPFTSIKTSRLDMTDTAPVAGNYYNDVSNLTTWTHGVATFGGSSTTGTVTGMGITEGEY